MPGYMRCSSDMPWRASGRGTPQPGAPAVPEAALGPETVAETVSELGPASAFLRGLFSELTTWRPEVGNAVWGRLGMGDVVARLAALGARARAPSGVAGLVESGMRGAADVRIEVARAREMACAAVAGAPAPAAPVSDEEVQGWLWEWGLWDLVP